MRNNQYILLIKSVFKEKTDNTLVQLFRYTFVGGFAFIVDFGTLFILTEYCNIQYLVSGAVGFILGLTINYFLSVKWVFSTRVVESRIMEFWYFSLIGIAGLGLNELLLWVLTDILTVYYLLSKIITTIILYLWNFFLRKFILFHK